MTSRNPFKACLAAVTLMTAFVSTCSVTRAEEAAGETNPIFTFRSAMINYFDTFGLVPILATRGFALGDVVQADG
jgi:hypothetical protein